MSATVNCAFCQLVVPIARAVAGHSTFVCDSCVVRSVAALVGQSPAVAGIATCMECSFCLKTGDGIRCVAQHGDSTICDECVLLGARLLLDRRETGAVVDMSLSSS